MNTFKLMTFLVLGVFWGQGCGAEHLGYPDREADGDSYGDHYGDRDADDFVDGDSDSASHVQEEECDEPGSTRAVPCGNCGVGSEVCGEDGFWQQIEQCFDEGECGAGEIETEPTLTCGEQQRICDETCQWRDWEETVPGGECEPGTTQEVTDGCASGWNRTDQCSGECTWLEGECVGTTPCGGTHRSTPPLSAEVCILAGTFVRGSDLFPDAQPVREVHLSSYFIDMYPVTNERYIECIDAGVCSRPEHNDYFYKFYFYPQIPVQGVDRANAETFCAWDGGRRLPTEAEWEKAARGPSPRNQSYVWGDDDVRCDLLVTPECPDFHPYLHVLPIIQDDVDSLPGTESYYGTFMMVGGGYEIVSDLYDENYYSDASSLINPTGSSIGDQVYRGARIVSTALDRSVSNRILNDGYIWFHYYSTVRCARDSVLDD